MDRHVCLKQWVNGNEISISIDDNLGAGFRGDVMLFHSNGNFNDRTAIGNFHCPTTMAEVILKALKLAKEKEGTRTEFGTRILTNHEGLEDD